MVPYLVAFGVLLHLLFWGAGLAALLMPRRWRAFWPVLAAPAGMALQSLVVWIGAHAGLPGTHVYAWPAEAIPILLWAAGLRRRPWFGIRDAGRFGGVLAVMAACLFLLVWPLVRAAPGLTSVSLGSCDAADYAAGARVFQEFSRASREGFLGLKDVVSVMSVDNFFDFWLRLNHFTPSALIAFQGTIFNCVPYELTSVATMAIFIASLPLAFWSARALFGWRRSAALALTALYGLCPLTWYAVDQVATAQLIAAPAIAVVTWAAVEVWRRPLLPSWSFAGVLAVGYVLILGSYNFIVVVCLAPAAAYAGWCALSQGDGARFGRWAAGVVAPLLVVGVIFWDRVAGLEERFRLFRTYDFGWLIHGLTPEGWVGAVGNTELGPLPAPWRWVLALALSLALADALVRALRRRDPRGVLVIATLLPVLAGYVCLLARGAFFGTNGSYDAYKLFCVFYPIFLPAVCFWGARQPRTGTLRRAALAVLAAAIAAGDLRGAALFGQAEKNAPLIVDRDLAGLRRVESMIGIGSLNMRLPDMWSRLWANAFLLRKRQYFPTHTYEGRRNTRLLGQWDLDGDFIFLSLPNAASLAINSQYSLAEVGSPYFLRASLGAGWYEPERLPRTSQRWRWGGAHPAFRLENPHRSALRIAVSLDARSIVGRDVQLWADGREIGVVQSAPQRVALRFPEFSLPPGPTHFELRSAVPPAYAPGDVRPLGIALYALRIEVLR